ncbi:MAG: PEP-CTERM sorting domain-containing protein [Spirulina sp.]
MLKTTCISLFLATSFIGVCNPANAISINYANTLVGASPSSFVPSAELLLNQPSTVSPEFSGSQQATYADFDSLLTYDTNTLASLIGISSTLLESADVIAFDANRGGREFESSIWKFEDSDTTLIHTHNILDAPNGPMVVNNEILGSALYNSIFGTNFDSDTDFGVILFDFAGTGIDTSDADFRITLQGGGTFCGPECPDVAQIGVLNVPEPSSLVGIVLVGLLLFQCKPKEET